MRSLEVSFNSLIMLAQHTTIKESCCVRNYPRSQGPWERGWCVTCSSDVIIHFDWPINQPIKTDLLGKYYKELSQYKCQVHPTLCPSHTDSLFASKLLFSLSACHTYLYTKYNRDYGITLPFTVDSVHSLQHELKVSRNSKLKAEKKAHFLLEFVTMY